MSDLGTALAGSVALMLIVEGLLPFCSPSTWRRVFERAMRLTDAQLKLLGLASMLAGLLMLVLVLP